MKWVKDGSLRSSGYGVPELKQCYKPYMSGSLAISILLQMACVATYYAFRQPELKSDLPWSPPVIDLGPLHFPPPLSFPNSTSGASASPRGGKEIKAAIPVPVPDPFIDSSSRFPTQTQLAGAVGNVIGEQASGTGSLSSDPGGISDILPPPIFQAVEMPPQIVKQVDPRYPEAAVRAGVPGTVYLRLWVDKAGKVRRAEVARSDNTIFDSAAVQAATQWLFTPAIMNHKPVSVWVTIPFKFRIEEHRP